jgi:hypothetical protein
MARGSKATLRPAGGLAAALFFGVWGGAAACLAQPVPPPETAAMPLAAPATPLSFDSVYAALAPYGNWLNLPPYGWCWRPAEAADPNWEPYCDGGGWIYTDEGWYWESDYEWGDIPFHYGRWLNAAGSGWVWVPGYDWAPAWVCWRYAGVNSGYCGWAPLPPGAVFVPGVGLEFNGAPAFDSDFGLPEESFVFIGFGDFWGRDFRHARLGAGQARQIYSHSAISNGYRLQGGRIADEGVGRDRVAGLTHRPIQPASPQNLRSSRAAPHPQSPGPSPNRNFPPAQTTQRVDSNHLETHASNGAPSNGPETRPQEGSQSKDSSAHSLNNPPGPSPRPGNSAPSHPASSHPTPPHPAPPNPQDTHKPPPSS